MDERFVPAAAVAVRIIAGFEGSLEVRFPGPGGTSRGALNLGKPRAWSIPPDRSGQR
jgi:hypothetical protein